eukprot:m.1521841 g.1521841  ORF g.1521841 m.1521841 type:complete len:97 (-) comp25229_c0_seq59:3149-3439(-)
MERLICCGMCTRLLAKSYHFNPPTAGDDYAITAHDLTSRYINLNGNPVTVNDGVLPTLTPQSVTGSAAGTLSVQPRSIVFSVVKGPTSVCSAGPAV